MIANSHTYIMIVCSGGGGGGVVGWGGGGVTRCGYIASTV